MDIRVFQETARPIKIRRLLRSANAMFTLGIARITIAALVSALIGFAPAAVAPAAAVVEAIGLHEVQVQFFNGFITPQVSPPTGGAACGAYSVTQLSMWWGEGTPTGTTCNSNSFSAYGTGRIVAPISGEVTFCTASDDGMYLQIGSSFTMGDWGEHPQVDCDSTAPDEPNIKTMTMVAGQSYPFTFWYHEQAYSAGIIVIWKYGDGVWENIPGTRQISVTASGASGTVTSSDSVMNCAWDGAVSTGTCSDTTDASVTLTATPDNAGDTIKWTGGCTGSSSTCTMSGNISSTNVQFIRTCSSTPGNIVSNCGFETGNFTNWTRTGDLTTFSVSPAGPYLGTYVLRARSVTGGTISQTLTTVAGRTYDVSFYLAPAGCPGTIAASLGSTTLLSLNVTCSSAPWTKYTYTYSATSSSTTLAFAITGSFYYWKLDEIVVTPRPLLTVTADSGSGPYGSAPSVGWTASSNGSPVTAASLTWASDQAPSCSAYADGTYATAVSATTTVGSYVSHCSGLSSAGKGAVIYDVIYVDGTYNVTKAPTSTVITCPTSVTYTGSPMTPCTATVTGAGGLSAPVTVGYTANTNSGTATAAANYTATTNYAASSDTKSFQISAASVAVTYTGDQLVVGSGGATSVSLRGTVNPGTVGCKVNFSVTGASSGEFTADTNSSGVATLAHNFDPGAYEVNVSLGDNCTGTADSTGAFVVSTPGYSSYGGGWYTSSGRTNFAYEVHAKPKTSPVAYTGQLVWGYKNAWRFKGTLTGYSTASVGGVLTGFATGTGTLLWWDTTLNDSLGGWAVAGTGVNVTIRFQPTVTGKKSSLPGAFGISLSYTRSGSQPTMASSDLQPLKFGGIKLT